MQSCTTASVRGVVLELALQRWLSCTSSFLSLLATVSSGHLFIIILFRKYNDDLFCKRLVVVTFMTAIGLSRNILLGDLLRDRPSKSCKVKMWVATYCSERDISLVLKTI